MSAPSTSDHLRVMLVAPEGCTGGAENMLLNAAVQLPRLGVSAALSAMRPGPLVDRARAAGIDAEGFRNHRYRDLGVVRAASRWLADRARTCGSQLFHSTHTAHLYAWRAARRLGLPEVWHLHDHPCRGDLVDWFIRRLPTTRTIFAIRAIVGSFPRQARGAYTVLHPTCVDLDRIRAVPGDEGVRERFRLPEGPLVLSVTRMQEYKGHRHLIRAAAEVLRERPDTVFAVAGKPSGAEQERYFADINRMAEETGIASRFRFLGYVGDADLVNLYRAAALVVHPAVNEGFSVTLQEAMAFGVPVVAAAADGPSELVEHDRTGLLVPTADAPALAAAILGLFRDPTTSRRLGDAARSYLEGHNIRSMAARFAEVYREVLGYPALAPAHSRSESDFARS